MALTFEKATKRQAKARVAITGPAGSGKTYTALQIAKGLGKKTAVIDTEHGSASKYADEFDFEVLQLSNFHPERYIEAIKLAETAGFEVVVIDSASHEWNGIGGCLELVDDAARRLQGNSYVAWKDVTPLHNRFIESIHQSKLHVIATFRSKMEYAQVEKDGRKKVEKLGLAPITRDGAEYEFDIVLDMDLEHTGLITKSRARTLADSVHKKPGATLAKAISDWLSDGIAIETKEARTAPQPPERPASSEAPSLALNLGGTDLEPLYDLAANLPRTPKTRPQLDGMLAEHGYEKTLKNVLNQHKMQCGTGCLHVAVA